MVPINFMPPWWLLALVASAVAVVGWCVIEAALWVLSNISISWGGA
jgi:hypothetical protein